MSRNDIQLSAAQLDVMRALWGLGEAPTARIVERVAARRSLAYTTVATMLSRLEKRGAVASRQQGREKIYRPLVSEAQVRSSMVSDLVSRLFRGEPAALVSHLVRHEDIGEEELSRVRELLSREGESGNGDD